MLGMRRGVTTRGVPAAPADEEQDLGAEVDVVAVLGTEDGAAGEAEGVPGRAETGASLVRTFLNRV